MKIDYSEILDYWDTQKPIRNGKTIHTAIGKAIEKQIPKKPYRISAIDSNDNAMVECPICKSGNETAIKTIKHIYCWKCGQAIDWSDYD